MQTVDEIMSCLDGGVARLNGQNGLVGTAWQALRRHVQLHFEGQLMSFNATVDHDEAMVKSLLARIDELKAAFESKRYPDCACGLDGLNPKAPTRPQDRRPYQAPNLRELGISEIVAAYLVVFPGQNGPPIAKTAAPSPSEHPFSGLGWGWCLTGWPVFSVDVSGRLE